MVHRGWSVPSGTQRKKRQKLCEGEVLPLDKSLLMGDFSEKLTQALRVQHAGVNADFLKHRPGESVHGSRSEACTGDLEATPPIVAQQCFSHLAAGGIVG